MKSTLKTVAFLLIVLIMVSSFGCSKQGTTSGEQNDPQKTQQPVNETKDPQVEQTTKENFNEEGLPIVNEPITLKMMCVRTPEHSDWDTIMMWDVMKERTNIIVEWEQISSQAASERLNTTLASGDLPDAFWGFGISTTLQTQYGTEGAFIDLSELIDNYAPNFRKYMDERPEVRKGIVNPDGKIYSLPRITEDPYARMDKFYINQAWLNAVGMDKPTNTDELYEVLKAFRDMDPNGNGEQDEIPIGGDNALTTTNYLTNFFKGLFGLMNKGKNHPYVDLDPSGNLRFIPTDPRYRDMLQYINKLYSEKLLDNEIFTQTTPFEFQARITKDDKSLLGCYVRINNMFSFPPEDYVALDAALIGPHGDQLYTAIESGISTGAFVITNVNQYPEETMRWVDYFYGDEGAELLLMGIEGVTFKRNENGELVYLDEILNAQEGFFQAISKYNVWSGATHAGIRSVKYGGNYNNYAPAVVSAAKIYEPYTPDEIWAPFKYTLEENDRISALQTDINNYVTEMLAAFVTGNTPLTDEEWNKYVKNIENMNLKEYLEIYKAAYERYQSLD